MGRGRARLGANLGGQGGAAMAAMAGSGVLGAQGRGRGGVVE